MITNEYDKEKETLFTKFIGTITLKDLLDDINYVCHDVELPRKLKIITDAREATFDFDIEAIPDLIEALRGQVSKYKSVKEAIIHNKPKDTALSMIYKFKLDEFDNFEYRVFSTYGACLAWLNEEL